MNIYKKTIKFFQDQRIAILIGLAGGITGCILGGQLNHYQAHFQQRSLPTVPKLAVEQMRPAAPENPPPLVAPDASENISSVSSSEESSPAASSESAVSSPAPESSAAAMTLPSSRQRLVIPQEEAASSEAGQSSAVSSEDSQSESAQTSSTISSAAPSVPSSAAASALSSAATSASARTSRSRASAPASASAASQAPAAPAPSRDFPAMGNAVHPVARVPNWGAMRTPQEWNRTYAQMRESDFVAIPKYNLSELTIPLSSLMQSRTTEDERILTAKLYYSTRYCGTYDLDAGEFTGPHCALDLKLPIGTPIGTVAGGRVQYVGSDARLGLHVIVEHHSGDDIFFSIYGHLGAASVYTGQDVKSGQVIGVIGMTGETSAPHTHFQIDRKQNGEGVPHQPYVAAGTPGAGTAAQFTINPIEFIQKY